MKKRTSYGGVSSKKKKTKNVKPVEPRVIHSRPPGYYSDDPETDNYHNEVYKLR